MKENGDSYDPCIVREADRIFSLPGAGLVLTLTKTCPVVLQ
jgi:hypothetical protein